MQVYETGIVYSKIVHFVSALAMLVNDSDLAGFIGVNHANTVKGGDLLPFMYFSHEKIAFMWTF